MPYHVKAAVNHMHYCSSAYINHYEIFLGEKCSRASREPLCPLFKWNKLVILRAWWIICNKSLGDFLLLVHRDCVFPKPPRTQGAEISPAAWDMSVCSNRAGGALGEPSKTGTNVAAPVQCWALVATWFGMQGRISSRLCTLQHWPVSLPEADVTTPDTAVLHRNTALQQDRVSLPFFFSSFWERETESELWIPRGLWQQIL